MHILVIESQPQRRDVLRQCCQEEGHTVSSYECFERVPKMPGGQLYGVDLVIFGPTSIQVPCNISAITILSGTTLAQVKSQIEEKRRRLHERANAFLPRPFPPTQTRA